MKMQNLLALSLTLLLGACHDYERVDRTDASADGVYRGVLSDATAHKSLHAHALDGLVLGFGLDDDARYSGQLTVHGHTLSGRFDTRDTDGQLRTAYRLEGHLIEGERIEASLFAPRHQAELSLFYSAQDTNRYLELADLRGVYVLESAELNLSLSIYPDGDIEGYDSAGCGYFGRVGVPDHRRNLFEVSIAIEGCGLDGEYAFGIGNLERHGPYGATLVLPIWLDESDRVESWVLERRS